MKEIYDRLRLRTSMAVRSLREGKRRIYLTRINDTGHNDLMGLFIWDFFF